ncbi:MAG: exodeoxyribonuclease VII small subunit [Pseudomonadota bacterium]
MSPKKLEENTAPPFEKALAELESLVEELEEGDLDLGDSLRKFERGVELARVCQQTLNDAEQKITQLSAADTPADEE